MFAEDLDAFLNDDEHALVATLQGGTTANVILDREAIEAFEAVVTSGPVATGKASDFAASVVNQTLTIAGTAYTIRERHLVDDGALVRLVLQAP